MKLQNTKKCTGHKKGKSELFTYLLLEVHVCRESHLYYVYYRDQVHSLKYKNTPVAVSIAICMVISLVSLFITTGAEFS